MRIVQAGRRAGKTHALVELVRKGEQRTDGTWSHVLIVSDERQAARLRHEHDLEPGQVISSQAWSKDRVGRRAPDKVFVDNLEDWLHGWFGSIPDTVTTSLPMEMEWGLT